VEKLALPNGSAITNLYDENSRLLGTWLKTSGGTLLDAATYGYNAGYQRTTYTNAVGTNVAYAYDLIGQLTAATSSISSENRGYDYDAAWNLNVLTNHAVTTDFNVNDKNELSSIGSDGFTYDADGNMTGQDSIVYTYDDEDRLEEVTAGETKTTFVYDGLSRLREQLQWVESSGGGDGDGLRAGVTPDTGGGTTWAPAGGIYYIYDGYRVIQERTTNNIPSVSYTRGNDLSGTLERAGGVGGLLARSGDFASGNFTNHNYYHADGFGNVTYLETAGQGLAASYRYDPFGNTLTSSGSLATANSYQFSSKEYVSSAGFYNYGYRFYSPAWQRWLNRDPIQENGGINLYSYVLNNPIILIDPEGLQEGDEGNGEEDFEGWLCGINRIGPRQRVVPPDRDPRSNKYITGNKGNLGPTQIEDDNDLSNIHKEWNHLEPYEFPVPPNSSPFQFPPIPPPVSPGNQCSTCVINNPPPIKNRPPYNPPRWVSAAIWQSVARN
jgi:RHS repeat-associated protein